MAFKRKHKRIVWSSFGGLGFGFGLFYIEELWFSLLLSFFFCKCFFWIFSLYENKKKEDVQMWFYMNSTGKFVEGITKFLVISTICYLHLNTICLICLIKIEANTD